MFTSNEFRFIADVTYVLSMPVLDEYPPETFLVLEVSLRNQFYTGESFFSPKIVFLLTNNLTWLSVVMCYEGDFVVE
jgi:hypothetical protein